MHIFEHMQLNTELLKEKAGEVSAILKLLASENRLMLLCQLVGQERSVGELGRLTGLRSPAVSQQLALLRTHGVVGQRREGQTIYYRLERPDVIHLMQTLYQLYCEKTNADEL